MIDVWLKYQQETGDSLETIKNRFEEEHELEDYIKWLEENLDRFYKLKDVLSHIDSDKMSDSQGIMLIKKFMKNETTIIGRIDSPFD